MKKNMILVLAMLVLIGLTFVACTEYAPSEPPPLPSPEPTPVETEVPHEEDQVRVSGTERVSMPFFSMNCVYCEAATVDNLAHVGLTVLYVSYENNWIEFEFDPDMHSLEEVMEAVDAIDAFGVFLNELELPQDELNAVAYAIQMADAPSAWDDLEELFPSRFQ